MGFWQRLKVASLPRSQGSGKQWDNMNSGGGSVKAAQTTASPAATTYTVGNIFQPGPNIEPYLGTAEWKNPDRLHGPPPTLLPVIPVRNPTTDIGSLETYVVSQGATANPQVLPGAQVLRTASPSRTRIRELEFDAANPRTIRTDQAYTASQRYFNQRVPVPEFTTPSVPAHAVYTFPVLYRRGWAQSFVPEPGMQLNAVGTAPPTLLSAPISVTTLIKGDNYGHRSPIQNVKAPKRIRSGG